MNSATSGFGAITDELLREDAHAVDERWTHWCASADPRNDFEECLLRQNVCLSVQLERVQRTYQERIRNQIANAEVDEREEASALGKRLFFDRAGSTAMYGIRLDNPGAITTSWSGKPIDPDDPGVLVRKLETKRAGCCWMLEYWLTLRERLKPGQFWQAHDRFRAIRLMGHQPIDVAEDRTIAQLNIAGFATNVVSENVWNALLGDMVRPELRRFKSRVMARWTDLIYADRTDECRAWLIELVERKIADLKAKIAEFDADVRGHAERTVARLGFDFSPEGEMLRREQARLLGLFFRCSSEYRKVRGGTLCGRGVGGPRRTGEGQGGGN